jgi:membrane protease YdiL (CAAX protease family)
VPGQSESVLPLLQAGLLVALVGGFAAAVAGYCLWMRHEPLFPPPRRWVVNWNGWVVLGAFLAYMIIQQLVSLVLSGSGFFQWCYGPDFPGLPDPGQEPTEQQRAGMSIRGLWVATFAFPLIVIAIIALRRSKGSRPVAGRRAAVVLRDAPANVVIAFLGWLVLTPLTFGVFAATLWIMQNWTGPQPEAHPLTNLDPFGDPFELALLALQAVVFAPIVEELLCRGTLLPWLLQRPPRPRLGQPQQLSSAMRSHLLVAISVALAFAMKADTLIATVKSQKWGEFLAAASPGLFMLALVPLYLAVPRWNWAGRRLQMPSARAGSAIWATAMLFAALHSGVWPSPIPLFVLGLGLGYVAWRTRSILAPILIHGMFNAVSVIALLKLHNA